MRRTAVIAWVLAGCFLLYGFPAMAHKRHEKKTPPPAKQAPAKSSPSSPKAEGTRGPSQPSVVSQPEPVETEEEEGLPPLRDLLFHHLHNKIVHFPIAFGLAGALFIFLARKWKEYENPAKVMLALGGIFAVAAYFTGRSQAGDFTESALHEIVELHENLGLATGISLWLGLAMLQFQKLKAHAWAAAVVIIILVMVTGFYGGILAHA